MPRKIRQLISDLNAAGFSYTPGKGSHRKFTDAQGNVVIISGKAGGDAKPYQERDVQAALQKAKS